MTRDAQLNARATVRTLELLRRIARQYEIQYRIPQVSQGDALERMIEMEAERLGIRLTAHELNAIIQQKRLVR